MRSARSNTLPVRLWPAAVMLLVGLVAAGCGSSAAPSDVTIGRATVETLDVLLLESMPVQVQVHARGYVGDGCTTLADVTQVREGSTFRVTITTSRPTRQVCTQQLVAFDRTIPLEGVVGLPAGTYVVDVNGARADFSLQVDNILR